jgi:hypothetical protein
LLRVRQPTFGLQKSVDNGRVDFSPFGDEKYNRDAERYQTSVFKVRAGIFRVDHIVPCDAATRAEKTEKPKLKKEDYSKQLPQVGSMLILIVSATKEYSRITTLPCPWPGRIQPAARALPSGWQRFWPGCLAANYGE